MDKTKIKDNIKVPDNLNEYILKGVDEGEKVNNLKVKNSKTFKPLKTAVIISIVSLGTITTAYAVDKIIEYFEIKKDSIYQHEKDDFLKYSKDINLSKKDKGIEFKIDTLAVDDGFFNMTYTITSDKKIADMCRDNDRAFAANPMIKIIKDGELLNNGASRFDYTEATFESDYILKGVLRKPIAKTDIDYNTVLTIDFDDIFAQMGDWKIDIQLNENLVSSESKKYLINKTKDIIKSEQYDHDTKSSEVKYKDVKINYTIDNVVLSPFGSLVTTSEKTKDLSYGNPVNIGGMFILRDDKGNYLDVIHNTNNRPDKLNKPVTNTYEFIKKSDDIKSITLIPYIYDEGFTEFSDQIDINSLPVTIDVSKYGKVTIEDFYITDNQIIYTYTKHGAVTSFNIDLNFYDEKGNSIAIGGMTEDFVNRDDGTHTMRYNLSQKKYKDAAKNINYISLRKENTLKLLEDQSIEFELNK